MSLVTSPHLFGSISGRLSGFWSGLLTLATPSIIFNEVLDAMLTLEGGKGQEERYMFETDFSQQIAGMRCCLVVQQLYKS